jgi:hypothetical protein
VTLWLYDYSEVFAEVQQFKTSQDCKNLDSRVPTRPNTTGFSLFTTKIPKTTESMAEEASQQVPLRLEELTANNAASELISEKRRPWQEVVADKVAIRDRLVQVHCRSLMAVQVENITSIDDVGDLTERLSVGEFTAEEVVRAYIQRSVDGFNPLLHVFGAKNPQEPAEHRKRSVGRWNCVLREEAD